MINIDYESGTVSLLKDGEPPQVHSLSSPEAFRLVSEAWLRCGWDTKYVYSFSWLGRPVIQLPEDLIRAQEVIFSLKPTLIIETGVAHGGSLIFYASLCSLMGAGRIIGIDIEIRAHNRVAIEAHELFPLITLVEGSSTAPEIVAEVRGQIASDDRVMVLLDSNHTRAHVLDELHAYADMVTVGSYIVATDGIMKDVVGAPRTNPDWDVNNPQSAVADFLAVRDDFVLETPAFPFNEGVVSEPVTYWPNGWLRRVR